MAKEAFTEPKRGSKTSLFLELSMRKQGVTRKEALLIAGVDAAAAASLVERLLNDCGYDIRSFGKGAKRTGKAGRPTVIYRCVGRFRWDGGYDDYLAPVYATAADENEVAHA